jgi:small subunit ribosomal protein S2
MAVNLSVEEMNGAGLQFGHKKSKVHPKMKSFLLGVRNTIFVIDLNKTKEKFAAALEYMRGLAAEDKVVIFVGTKTQFKKMIKETAMACGMPYVSERWMGGTFTNFKIIKKRVDHYKELERKTEAGEFEKYTKKEQAVIQKEIKVLEKKFEGIKMMERIPDAMFVVDMEKDKLAIKEARQNGVKVIGIADVNINPDLADYPIIANDDAVTSVKYILEKAKEAITEGKQASAASASANASKEN